MSAYLDWKAGDKIVCVDGGPRNKLTTANYSVLPCAGSVYEIRRISRWTWADGRSAIGVWLVGLDRPLVRGVEHPWNANRFRPAQTRKTDISVFTAMLTDTKQKVRA